MSLLRTDLFGFTPGGPVLDAEEAYGDDWDPRRGGQVLGSEEDYSFSLSSDEDDDDLDDDDLSESFGDDSDDQLDQILTDMESEESEEDYGQDNLDLAPDVEQCREELATVIRDGVRNAFLGESDGIQKMFRNSAEWVSDKFEQMMAPGDMEEIAQALLNPDHEGTFEASFCDWNNLTDADRQFIVHKAIWSTAWPGINISVDDKLWEAWSAGVSNLPSSAFEIAKAALTADLPRLVHAAFAENLFIGNLMQAAGWDPQNADQLRNERAMTMWLLGKFGVPIDAYVAQAISEEGQAVIAACQPQGRLTETPTDVAWGPTDVARERMADEFVASPVQEISDVGTSMPAPEQILAFGYGFTVLGSLAGFFR